MFSDRLTEALLSICELRNLSYEAASELCDISPRHFGDIIRKDAAPTITVLEKICKAFHVNAASPCIQEATENAVMQISMINRRNQLSGLEHQFEKLTTEERLIQRKEKPGPVLEAYWNMARCDSTSGRRSEGCYCLCLKPKSALRCALVKSTIE